MKSRETAASEVIGAVLLISLVVIGGAVVAAFVFGQPAPKELPDVNFGVYKENPTKLVLHHTGGDSLQWGDYSVYVYPTGPGSGSAVTDRVDDHHKANPWSSGDDMTIDATGYPEYEEILQGAGRVVLSYKDGSAGETVLRKVVIEDGVSPVFPGKISGHKYETTGNGNDDKDNLRFPGVVEMILLRENSDGDFVQYGPTKWTRVGDGYYEFDNLPTENEKYIVKENLASLTGWEAVKPNTDGTSHTLTLSRGNPTREVDFKNRRAPPTTTVNTQATTTTSTTTTTPTVTQTETVTVTPTPIPATISGHKYRVDENGVEMANPYVSGITIYLEKLVQVNNNKWEWRVVASNQTDANGYYEFPSPTDGGTYQLREDLNSALYTVYSPAGGIISGVLPGATNQDFRNTPIVGDGVVMYLKKDVQDNNDGIDNDGGYVVDGTYLQGEASGGDTVTINGYTYVFDNNEEFRFTIDGDQYSGEFMLTEHDITKLTFRVKFQVRAKNGKDWVTPEGMGSDPVIGKPTSLLINQLNKNTINPESTLTYRFPQYVDTDTLLRLNGKVRIDSPADNTYLEFTTLHIVHDNRYGEGLNTIWIMLEPGYDYILAQGDCLSP
jgi:FlaG/FlaF family flagellin (archaellin)